MEPGTVWCLKIERRGDDSWNNNPKRTLGDRSKLLVLKMRKNIASETVKEDERMLVVAIMNIVSEVRN